MGIQAARQSSLTPREDRIFASRGGVGPSGLVEWLKGPPGLLYDAHAWIRRTVHSEVLVDMNRFACLFPSARNCCANSLLNSRSRFFENTA